MFKKTVELNNIYTEFSSFPETKTLEFISVSDSIMGEPSEMLLYKDNLIMKMYSKNNEKLITLFSLKNNKETKYVINRGAGPNEFLDCIICMMGDNLWLYDIGKQRLGKIQYDSLLVESYSSIEYYKMKNRLYRYVMLNDSICIGSNNFHSDKKLTYINIKTGEEKHQGEYAYLDKNIPLAGLIDASSCYIGINPKNKNIVLSYRYTDMVEIYDSEGNLKHALFGPEGFDLDFRPYEHGMLKTPNTRKAFVTSYTTEKAIYILYSGRKREEGWAHGSEIYVYSWDGKPLRKYLLEERIYTFAVDEKNQHFYIFSLETDKLVKAKM